MFIFEIHGNPIPQKQTMFVKKTGHAYNPSRKDIEGLQWQIRHTAPKVPLTCPVETTFTFFVPMPKTSKIRMRQMLNRIILPSKKPDLDNLAYLVTNALKGIVYEDDNQIIASHNYKFYSDNPRTIIKVRPILCVEEFGYKEVI